MFSEIADAVKEIAKRSMNQIHTAIPCRVIEVTKEGYVTVKPYGMVTLNNGSTLPYPEVTDVPVVFPSSTSANIGIAFPIAKNDDGILIISESELDSWRNNKTSSSRIKFDLTSGIFIPGLSRDNKLFNEARSKNALILQKNNTSIYVKNGEVEINGNLKVNGTITYNEGV